MNDKELKRYVYEQHISGMSDTQIAKKLGMTVEELVKKLNMKIGADISQGADYTAVEKRSYVKEDVIDDSDEDEDDGMPKGFDHTF